MSLGNNPPKLLSVIRKDVKASNCPISTGKDPVKPFPWRANCVSFSSLSSLVGRLLAKSVSKILSKLSDSNSVILVRSSGMLLVIAEDEMSNRTNLLSRARDGGNDPVSSTHTSMSISRMSTSTVLGGLVALLCASAKFPSTSVSEERDGADNCDNPLFPAHLSPSQILQRPLTTCDWAAIKTMTRNNFDIQNLLRVKKDR
mmetsp:Transcript_1099/g.1298  ORF Transcript_1099/g.1298 Transcript_1099/m.1298 type:complete len:201 (+) Transcript_1099:1418-2020(+)